MHALVPADWADRAAMAAEAGRAPFPAPPAPDDLAVLIPTSGTTGQSKLVMQTHRAYAMAGEGFPFWMELTAADRLMTTLPLFHVNAPAYSVLGSLACGAGLVLVARFSASGFLDAARRHGATEFNAIGAMLEILMRQPERPDDADTPLRLCYTGPAPSGSGSWRSRRRFGLRIVVGYAMSESPYGLIWPHGTRPVRHARGRPPAPDLGVVNEARVVDDDGRGRRRRRVGRAAAAQPGRHAAATRACPRRRPRSGSTTAGCTPATWSRSTTTGRTRSSSTGKEVLRRRGENLSPLEVEEVLDSHPAVVECAVVGVPSELSEEEVKAFVVAVAGAELDFGELRDVRGRPARGVQGAAILAAARRAAADADRPGRQAPAARRSSARGVRRGRDGTR